MVNPVGPVVSTTPALFPSREVIEGNLITLEPLHSSHALDLFQVVGGEVHAALWDYMGDGSFPEFDTFQDSISHKSLSKDPVFWAAVSKTTRKAIGYLTLMRIDPANRVIEIGNIMLSPLLQRTTAATECIYLLACNVFETLGYRRFEWKCNNLNTPSKRAAERLGFTFEGIFRQHLIVKGRNRDTAWYSLLDSEWPLVKLALEKWLHPTNFDELGNQKLALQAIRHSLSQL